FIDWARREAAPARDVVPQSRTLRDAPAARGAGGAGAGVEAPGRATPFAVGTTPEPGAAGAVAADDWAAGPPWVTATRPDAIPEPSELGYPVGKGAGSSAVSGAGAAAGLAAGAASFDEQGEVPGQASFGMIEEPEPPAFLAGRSLDDGRPVAYQQVAAPATHRAPVGHAGLGAEQRTELERAGDPAAPAWERPRRKEAYPTLRTRAGLRPGGRGVPRLILWVGILGIAILVVFAVPFFVRGLGGGPSESPSPGPTALASPSAEPTATPVPVATPVVYTVKSGDILSKIAAKYKVTVDQILEANPKITNPNRIQPGDKITIPTPPPEEIVNEGEITPAP
ncbi:MAG: LysM domain, partial [Chloroflexi bacterium]|nr:LysM domain [Chloroflexota bacterium]